MQRLAGIIGLMVLGACTVLNQAHNEAGWTGPNLAAETRRELAASFQDIPFEGGASVSVVANEHGDLHTYRLTPCGGDHICGLPGHIGHIEQTPDYFVVTGAYPGRTFYLSPGGDGYLTWRGVNRDLAWN